MTPLHARRLRVVVAGFGGAIALAVGLLAAIPSLAPAKSSKPYTCSGTLHAPGSLTGSYPNGVVVKGFCAVNAGKAHVIGTLTVTKTGVLGAAFGANSKTHHGGSSLLVTGNVVVNRGGTAIIGCKVNPDGSGFPCIDEPNQKHPTLKSSEHITGSLIENAAYGVVVHNSKIDGSVKETGGGNGLNCTPSGVFKAFMSPPYFDYEDSTVKGDMTISGLVGCYLAVIRDHVQGNLTFTNNKLADPDAIEVELNHVGGNLACTGNTNAVPTSSAIWDSHEANPNNGSFFPRIPGANTVKGKRSGQCVTPTPLTMGGPSGTPGTF
jgi:hypothetical protein